MSKYDITRGIKDIERGEMYIFELVKYKVGEHIWNEMPLESDICHLKSLLSLHYVFYFKGSFLWNKPIANKNSYINIKLNLLNLKQAHIK